jgi:hypothetical protein
VKAALHKLAAKVELATPERERWIVQTVSFYDARGRVYLELSTRSRPRPRARWRCSRRWSTERARLRRSGGRWRAQRGAGVEPESQAAAPRLGSQGLR